MGGCEHKGEGGRKYKLPLTKETGPGGVTHCDYMTTVNDTVAYIPKPLKEETLKVLITGKKF